MPSTAASVGGQLPLRGGDHRGDFLPCQRNRRVDGGGEMISQRHCLRRTRVGRDLEPTSRGGDMQKAECSRAPRKLVGSLGKFTSPRSISGDCSPPNNVSQRAIMVLRFSATSAAAMVLMMSSKAARSKIGNPMSPGAAAKDAMAGSMFLGEVAIFSIVASSTARLNGFET